MAENVTLAIDRRLCSTFVRVPDRRPGRDHSVATHGADHRRAVPGGGGARCQEPGDGTGDHPDLDAPAPHGRALRCPGGAGPRREPSGRAGSRRSTCPSAASSGIRSSGGRRDGAGRCGGSVAPSPAPSPAGRFRLADPVGAGGGDLRQPGSTLAGRPGAGGPAGGRAETGADSSAALPDAGDQSRPRPADGPAPRRAPASQARAAPATVGGRPADAPACALSAAVRPAAAVVADLSGGVPALA